MKKLDLNNSKDLLSLKESLNKKIDEQIAKQQLSEKIDSLKGLSFGEYKVLFESTLDDIYDTESGKKLIASYVKLLKENKSINSLYRLFESIREVNPDKSSFTAYALADVCEGVDRKVLCEGEKKMYNICKAALKESKNTTCDGIDEILSGAKLLNESVSFLTHKSDKSDLKKVGKRAECISTLYESINKNEEINKTVNESKSNKELLSDLNALLENTNQTWEKRVLNDLSMCYMSNGDKSELFETYKNDCISTIDEMSGDDLDKDTRLHAMKVQLMEKKYSEETLTDDLFKLAELKETLIEG